MSIYNQIKSTSFFGERILIELFMPRLTVDAAGDAVIKEGQESDEKTKNFVTQCRKVAQLFH